MGIMGNEECAKFYVLDDEREKYIAKNHEANRKYRQKIKAERRDDRKEVEKPIHVKDKVICINCKKILKQIYLHILVNEECAKFYVLDDEREKYRTKNHEANRKYRQKIKDERRSRSQKNYRKRLMEEQGEEEFKAKQRRLNREYRQNLTEEKKEEIKAQQR